MEKRIALLIDAENTSASYVKGILKEANEYGVITYKRMYGDFTKAALSKWNKVATDYSIVPIQQPHYSKAKNASDIMLVIDAMDILYAGNVEGFCIVSSDSDFTRLVSRLMENGKDVIGMGMSNASKTLKAACTTFKNLEILGEEGDSKKAENEITPIDDITPMEEIVSYIFDIIDKKANAGKETGLGEIGSQLGKEYKDFDVRNYGYKSLTTFVEDTKKFDVIKDGTTTIVRKSSTGITRADVEQFIVETVSKKSMKLSELGTMIHEKYKDFSHKAYGYSTLGKFVSSISEVDVKKGRNRNSQQSVSIKKKQ
jgi:uncharacterized protein (TIGR00288 family)